LIVVLDSNVWISALHFRGAPLLALCKASAYDSIACCNEIRTEVQRALVEVLGWELRNAELALKDYAGSMFDVPITGALHGICRDPKDDMVFECALVAQAQLIVTGDRDLLAVGVYGSIRVITVRAYLDHPAD
jgi:putative PIN family toxin of toxin-antitoxin system